ncbi:MAG: flagellar biosynthesis protein FlaG [Gammaproteobacteria bacterium]|nr:MAG: flagellar biosynthesis protein FlaG [Gammaproteobacteria bacterium]
MINDDLSIQASSQGFQVKVETKQQEVEKLTPALVPSELEKESDKAVSKQDALQSKITQLNQHMQSLNRNLQFSVDDTSGDTIVKVIDSETDKLIRQIPSQEVIDSRHAIEDFRGLILETKA